ncbi:MAG: prolyl oligopeptidase family serine peptidase [Acidimicrobiales bacterium]
MVRPLTPADLLELRSVTAVALHPDGDQVAYTVGWPDAGSDENRSQLWSTRIHGRPGARYLFIDAHRVSDATYSPDGTRLACIVTPAKGDTARAEVYDLETGVRTALAGLPDGVDEVAWIDDARLAALGASRPADQIDVGDDELDRRPRVVDDLAYRFNGRDWIHDRPTQVWVLDAVDPTVEPVLISDGVHDHAGLAPHPDGDRVLTTVRSDTDTDLTGLSRIVEVATDGSGLVLSLVDPPGEYWGDLGWTADRHALAIGIPRPDGIQLDRLHLLDPNGGTTHELGSDDVSQETIRVSDDAVFTLATRGVRVTVDRNDLQSGETTVVVDEPGVVVDFDVDRAGTTVVAAITTPTRPAELWHYDLVSGASTRLIALNDDLLAEVDLAEPEVVRVPSGDGASVEAILTRPPASAFDSAGPDGRRPGLVYVHGGPTFAYNLGFFDEFQLAAAAGYVVIGANPRGSDGYGTPWASTIRGRLGTVDFDDVQAVADALSELPEVDDARVGIGGGSYGGFMSAWAIGHTDRFAAALIERCVINWESFIGTSDIGPHFARDLLLEGEPLRSPEGLERLRAQSPIQYVGGATTPSLILHSEADWRCPPEQAEQLFTALRIAGCEVRLARFPGENHELSRSGKPSHRVERFELIHDHYATHLGGGRLGQLE